jgi:hypothetical protein
VLRDRGQRDVERRGEVVDGRFAAREAGEDRRRVGSLSAENVRVRESADMAGVE